MSFNDDWLFLLVDLKDEGLRMKDEGRVMKDFGLDDSSWRALSLPHDWSAEGLMSPNLYSCTGYLPGGTGWYRKHFRIPSSLIINPSSIFICFEGVYNRSEVYLNGHLLGSRPNGYASFLYEMTPYLNNNGDNVLAVRVDHSRQADSRWYTGSGIYRDVWLVAAPKTHLALWGSAWRLKAISESEATLEVDIETEGEAAGNLQADVIMADTDGKTVAQATTNIRCPEKRTVELILKSPHRWSLSDPYLYTVETKLQARSTRSSGGQGVQEIEGVHGVKGVQVVQDNSSANSSSIGKGNVLNYLNSLNSMNFLTLDSNRMRIGLRTISFDPDKGFALNGEAMKIKGVCLHHDAGVLGSAVPIEVLWLRLRELKDIGVNAIRTSHNPQAPAFYDLCDEMGFLVMDEASDEWEFPKRKWLKGWNKGEPGYEGSYDFFEEWMERDVADMVRRDRHHPSVFLWSIGNEVDYPNDPYTHPVLDGDGSHGFTQPVYGGYKPQQPDARRIGKIARRLAEVVRGIDSSRAVTGALAGVVMSNQTEYPEAIDVVGYNYTENRYAEDHKKYPKRVIYGSENRHDLAAWLAVRDNDHIAGQFLWTGADFLGEAGAWPSRGSSTGLLNLASLRKPIGWYRAALWREKPVCYIGTYPLHHGNAKRESRPRRGKDGNGPVHTWAPDVWNYDIGQDVRVVCYTNQPAPLLLLNGKPLDLEAQYDTATGVFYWDIKYQPGTIRAETEAASYEIKTSEEPFSMRITDLSPESSDYTCEKNHNSGTATRILLVEIVDHKGTPVSTDDRDITCSVEGPARLLGLENGNMSDTTYVLPQDNKTSIRRSYQGKLVAYVQGREEEDGKTVVRFTSPKIKTACFVYSFFMK